MRLFAGTAYDRPPRCDHCGALEEECKCAKHLDRLIPPEKQVARLSVEKRKKGKVVTVIRGLAAAGNDLPALLARLKSQCGASGTLQEEALEIQGEHLDRISAVLEEIGYRVRS
jgi:translation initiation factor 1